jgi:hypothetical protein
MARRCRRAISTSSGCSSTIAWTADYQIQFTVISRPSVSRTEDPRGLCPTSCDPPPTLTPLLGAVHVPFTGGPSPFVDPASIIGLRWRVPDSSGIAVTIDDIMFVNE